MVGRMTVLPLAIHRRRARQQVAVTYYQPTGDGTFPGTGTLLGEVWVRGELHHYRISIGAFVLLAPPHWLGVESFPAVLEAGLTVPERLMPRERMAMEAVQ